MRKKLEDRQKFKIQTLVDYDTYDWMLQKCQERQASGDGKFGLSAFIRELLEAERQSEIDDTLGDRAMEQIA